MSAAAVIIGVIIHAAAATAVAVRVAAVAGAAAEIEKKEKDNENPNDIIVIENIAKTVHKYPHVQMKFDSENLCGFLSVIIL